MTRARIKSSAAPIDSMSSAVRCAAVRRVVASLTLMPPPARRWIAPSGTRVTDCLRSTSETATCGHSTGRWPHCAPSHPLMAAITTYASARAVGTARVGGMFEYFTGPKYVWNLGVCATLNNGGAIDEVDRACRPAREAPDVNCGSKIFMAVVEGGRRPGRRPGAGVRGRRAPAHRRPAVVPLRALRLPGRADAVATPTPAAGSSTSRRSTRSPRSSSSPTRRRPGSRSRSRAPRCRRTSPTRARTASRCRAW